MHLRSKMLQQISSWRTHRCFKDEFVFNNLYAQKSSLWQSCAIDLLEEKFDGLTKELTISGGVKCTASAMPLAVHVVTHFLFLRGI